MLHCQWPYSSSPLPKHDMLMSLQSGCKPWAGQWRSGRMDFQGKPCRRSRRWRLSWTNWRRKGPRSSFSWTPWRLLCKNRNKKSVFKRDRITEFNTIAKRLAWTTVSEMQPNTTSTTIEILYVVSRICLVSGGQWAFWDFCFEKREPVFGGVMWLSGEIPAETRPWPRSQGATGQFQYWANK